jgi:hypothetical protein
MNKLAGTMVGATLGGVAAVAAYTMTGPFGLMMLASTLVTINSAADIGGSIAELTDPTEPSFNIRISIQ